MLNFYKIQTPVGTVKIRIWKREFSDPGFPVQVRWRATTKGKGLSLSVGGSTELVAYLKMIKLIRSKLTT